MEICTKALVAVRTLTIATELETAQDARSLETWSNERGFTSSRCSIHSTGWRRVEIFEIGTSFAF